MTRFSLPPERAARRHRRGPQRWAPTTAANEPIRAFSDCRLPSAYGRPLNHHRASPMVARNDDRVFALAADRPLVGRVGARERPAWAAAARSSRHAATTVPGATPSRPCPSVSSSDQDVRMAAAAAVQVAHTSVAGVCGSGPGACKMSVSSPNAGPPGNAAAPRPARTAGGWCRPPRPRRSPPLPLGPPRSRGAARPPRGPAARTSGACGGRHPPTGVPASAATAGTGYTRGTYGRSCRRALAGAASHRREP